MGKPSNTAYHLGHVVTANTTGALLLSWACCEAIKRWLTLDYEVFFFASAIILVPVIVSEPTRRREKPARFGPANQITMFRGVLISLVATLVGFTPNHDAAFAATIIALMALSMDGLDGYVARKTDTCSMYGAQLDMEFDAVFMLLLSILIYQWGHAGVWVLFCGLARYGWLSVQLFVPWFKRPLPDEPAFRRKTACVVGVGGLTLAIFPWSWPWLNTGLAGVATFALLVSFAIDALWLIARKSEPLS